MSTTFTAHTRPVAHVITCCDGAATQAPRYGTYDDAVAAYHHIPGAADYDCADMRPVLPGCTMPDICPAYPLRVQAVHDEEPPVVHLHDRNAELLLGALGLTETAGECDADDMLARVALARAMHPADEGVPAVQDGRVLVGERPAGYLDGALAAVERLALWCRERALPVTWA